MSNDQPGQPSRRRFNQMLRGATMLGVGGQSLLHSGNVKAAVSEAQAAVDNGEHWPAMSYRTLGRTGHRSSRLIYGCGAALSRRRADELLNRALDAGVNTFDVGTSRYYDSAEMNLAPFLQQHKQQREKIFLISKSMTFVDLDANAELTSAVAEKSARNWLKILDESLSQLRVDQVDAYYMMAANNPALVTSDEFYRAFEKAKAAGKTRFLGLSTHENAAAVLTAAADSGRYDLAMIAVTPAGWYDWNNKGLLKNTPTLAELAPVLEHARKAGIGLIGMKAARALAGRSWFGSGDTSRFNEHYSDKLLNAPYSDFQRSYAYVLEHGLDAVNADIQGYQILRENFVAAATSGEMVV